MISIKKALPVVVILVILGVGGYLLLSGGGVEVGDNGVSVRKESKSYTFSALKAAIEAGVPLKCEYEVGGNSAEGYVKGRNWRGKMTFGDGRTGEVIIKDNCMWSWGEGESQGVKMCFEPTEDEKSIWDQPQTGQADVNYRCTPASVNDSMFNPPSDIQFTGLDSFGGTQTVY